MRIKEIEAGNIIWWSGFSKISHKDGLALRNECEWFTIAFFCDDKGLWLNLISVNDYFANRGIATVVMRRAIRRFGKILFSSATSSETRNNGLIGDNRYLTSEGLSFVKSLIRKKVISPCWIQNPYSLAVNNFSTENMVFKLGTLQTTYNLNKLLYIIFMCLSKGK